MNFDLTDEQKMIREMARNFAREVIAPRGEEIEQTGEYPYDIISQMADLGMMGIPFPESYGGSGGDWVGMHLCLEELAWGDLPVAMILIDAVCLTGQELYVFGNEDQKRKWLVDVIKGKETGAFALTEPDSGSDAKALKTRATLQGDYWVLNGTKQFVTNIGLETSSIALVAAISGKDEKGNIISAFIVPKNAPGFVLGKRYRKLAMHALPTHEVNLEDCMVPRENLLGDPSKGFAQHLAVLQTGRISMCAVAVGVARACLEQSLRYSKERIQFGQPIFNFQAVQFKLADMAVSIELARNQYLKAASLKDHGKRHQFEATVAKLFGSEMLEKVASDALQIHGGYGYMEEYPVSRYYKYAKLLQIVEGTSEVQRMVIGRIIASS